MIDIKRFCFDMGISQAVFGEKIGVDQSVVSHMIRGTRKVRQDHIDKLESIYGEDVVKPYLTNDVIADWFNKPQSEQVEATIIPASVIEEAKAEAKQEELIPYVSKDLVQARDLDIRQLVLNKSDELKYKVLSDLFGDMDYIQRVITSAMMPLFQPGDLLFIKFLPNDAKVISGAIYLIDTRKYGAMVRQVYVEQDHFLLCSRNPDFEDLRVPRADIYSVGLVVNMVRSDFNMPSEYPNVVQMMSNRDKQTDNLIEQIDNLIEQIDKAGERESRLISILEGKYK